MTYKIVNLTPHAVSFVGEDGTPTLVVQPTGVVARIKATTVVTGSIKVGEEVIPVTSTEYGEVEGLPEPSADTVYLVSSLVAQRCSTRADVFIPAESVRDSQGRIIGCKSLGKI